MSRPFTPISERIKTKYVVDPITDCWEWTGAMASSGYGKIGCGGHSGRTLSAHRAAWEIAHGEIPDRLQVLHSCDNKKCVNPQHLFLGTQSDNILDCIRKGRAVRKLTNEDVLQIRRSYLPRMSQCLADQFRVCASTVQRIVQRKSWKHI